MKHTKIIAAASALTVISLLHACGGGGSGGGGGGSGPGGIPSEVPPGPVVAPASTAAKSTDRNKAGNLFQSSYENFRAQGSQPMPGALLGSSTARALGNFFGSGTALSAGAFVSIANYNAQAPGATQASAKPSTFAFLRKNADGSYGAPDTTLWDGSSDGCSDATSTAVTDFNQDGKADLFVTCSGYPNNPWPGDTNRLVLSQPDGRYKISVVEAGAEAGPTGLRPNFASASAADLNGDGYPDVVLVSNFASPIVILYDPAKNNFTKEEGARANGLSLSNFKVHLADADGDGTLDLLVGGDETTSYNPAKTQIFLNDGSNRFATEKPIVLPAPPAGNTRAYVLDFLVTGTTAADRTIWVLRRNPNRAGADGKPMSTIGRDIQKVRWTEAAAGTATYNAAFSSPESTVHHLMAGTKTGTTTPWVLAEDKGLNGPLEATPGLEIK